METTMAGQAQLALMREARANGLSLAVLFFSVRSPEICLERIARRVAEGGHDVAEPIVRRRFARSHENLPAYTAEADLWRIYEASAYRPCLAAEGSASLVRYADPECLSAANPAVGAFTERLHRG